MKQGQTVYGVLMGNQILNFENGILVYAKNISQAPTIYYWSENTDASNPDKFYLYNPGDNIYAGFKTGIEVYVGDNINISYSGYIQSHDSRYWIFDRYYDKVDVSGYPAWNDANPLESYFFTNNMIAGCDINNRWESITVSEGLDVPSYNTNHQYNYSCSILNIQHFDGMDYTNVTKTNLFVKMICPSYDKTATYSGIANVQLTVTRG